MLIFGDGLRIRFWNVKKQRTEGVIQFKTTLTPDAYIVDTIESGSCMVHEDQIIQVRMRDMNGDDIWVSISHIYESFPNGTVITPLTKYNTSLDVVTIDPPDTTSLEVHLSPIRHTQLTSNFLKYAIRDEKAVGDLLFENAFKRFLKEVKTMNILNFEVEYNSIYDNMRCRLDFEIDVHEAWKYEPLMRRIRGGLQMREFGEFVLSTFLDASNLPKPKKVIFHDPATIVFWEDGTKTVVKRSEGEPDDKEKAIMYCVFKKVIGNKSKMDKYIKTFMKEDKSNEEKKEADSSKLHWKKQRAGSDSSESTV